MRFRFHNNAKTTLLTAVSDVDTQLVLEDASSFASELNNGDKQALTLSDADGQVLEIVYATAVNGNEFTVERGYEGTTPQEWPVGTTVSVRITAKALESFIQTTEQGEISTGNSNGFKVNRKRSTPGKVIQIAGWPVLGRHPAQRHSDPSIQDQGLSYEAVGWTYPVSLGAAGTIGTWQPGMYYGHGTIVQPTTPDGYQYTLEAVEGEYAEYVAVEPEFYGPDGVVEVRDAENVLLHLWVPTPIPAVVLANFSGFSGDGLLVTEVGFICSEYGGAVSTTPSVSVGTQDDPTRFANNVPLAQITGSGQVHRIPVTGGGSLVGGLKFTTNTAADDVFVGRFYWRGIFIEL